MGPKLVKLTLKNYRSFVDESTAIFPETGLLSLNGKNLDTGGGSGSGKSNFMTAIAHILGFSPLPFTEFKSWYSEKTPSLSLELETRLGPVKIERSKTLRLWINEEEEKGSVDQKEEKIDEIFGMGAEFRKLLTYRGQRQPGAFLSNTDAKKKEFLMQVLGLDKFETALEVSSKNITKLESDALTLSTKKSFLEEVLAGLVQEDGQEETLANIEIFKSSIKTSQEALVLLKGQLADLQKDVQTRAASICAASNVSYLNAVDRYKQVENEPFVTDVDRTELNRLAKMVATCKERIDSLTEEDRVKKSALNVELRKLQEMVDVENGKVAQIPGLEKQINRLKLEIVKLEAGRCSMCDRTWEEAKAKVAGFVLELSGLDAKVLEFQKSKNEVVVLQQQMLPFRNFEPNSMIAQMVQAKAGLETKYAVEKQSIDSQKSIYLAEKNAKVSELKKIASDIYADGERQAREYLESRKYETVALENMVVTLTGTLAVDQQNYNHLQQRLARIQHVEEQRKLYQPQLDQITNQLLVCESGLMAEKDFLSLIGREGFLGSIFDEILVEISDETNSMLANVANTRHVTIEFKSESVTQKGTVSRSIVPMVTVGGNESSIKSGLSGGMLSVVELATDLAVGRVIATRTGSGIPFLLLDEALDGLGVVEKETALELIQNYAQDRLVIMTDHSSETKALFTKTINIEYLEGKSRIV